MAAKQNFIAGTWVDGVGVTQDINPSDISDVVGEFSQASKAQTDGAIAAAKAASFGWGLSTPQQRCDALEMIGTELLARKDEIGRLLARENGKPLGNGVAETMRAAQIFKFFAQEALRVEGTHVPSVRTNKSHHANRLARNGHLHTWPHGRHMRALDPQCFLREEFENLRRTHGFRHAIAQRLAVFTCQ